jgi:methylmalonyl-CoA carboxyltransferase 12S subunit
VILDETASETQETTMSEPVPNELRATLQEIRSQLSKLAERLTEVEKLVSATEQEPRQDSDAITEKASTAESSPATPSVAVEVGISEQEVLAISAAIAAWLGVHAHIRQIRLIRTGAWAQQGRVTIQASHRLNH